MKYSTSTTTTTTTFNNNNSEWSMIQCSPPDGAQPIPEQQLADPDHP